MPDLEAASITSTVVPDGAHMPSVMPSMAIEFAADALA